MADTATRGRAARWMIAATLLLIAGIALVNLTGPSARSVASDPARPLPALTGRVVDNAAVLSAFQRAALVRRLRDLEDRTGIQLVIVTLPSLQGESIEVLGRRLGNGWGIGQQYLDNGALLIVAPADRQVRIEVGRGLEGRIPNARAAAIIEDSMLPVFATGAIADGIERGANAIIDALD